MTPQSTPREALYLETGLIEAVTQIKANRIMHYLKTNKKPNTLTNNIIQQEQQTKWQKETLKILQEYELDDHDITNTNPHRARQLVKNATRKKFKDDTLNAGNNKSKINYLIENSGPDLFFTMKGYMTNLTRLEASTLFKTRSRMLDVKTNYKNKYRDQQCRKCNLSEETQQHILEECPEIHQDNSLITPEHKDFGSSIILNRIAAKKILQIMENLQT